ncbi:MAG: hypothetical protein ACRCS0_01030 [Albidovulum sp.]
MRRGAGDQTLWAGVFDPDETILWSGGPSLPRRLAVELIIAVAALIVATASLRRGGLWSVVTLLTAFFLVRRFWLHGLGVSAAHYAITTRHIGIRQMGVRSWWQKYPLSDYFLQKDLGVLRVFHRPPVPVGGRVPKARLIYLPRAERRAALLAANGVERQNFHIPARHAREPMETLVPRLLAHAGAAKDGSQPLLWQGQPLAAAAPMPLILGAAAAMLLATFALIAAIKGDGPGAISLGFWAILAGAAEVAWFRWQSRREASVRYAIAGRYAIRIGRGIPLLTLACDVHRIEPRARIQTDALSVAYAPIATFGRYGWTVYQIAFLNPPALAEVARLLQSIADRQGAAESRPTDQALTRNSGTAQDTRDRAEARP